MSLPFYAGTVITAAALDALPVQVGYTSTLQTVNSTSQAPVNGLTNFTVLDGVAYDIRAVIFLDCNSGGQGEFKLTGPASPTLLIMNVACFEANSTSPSFSLSGVSDSTGYNTGFLDTLTFGTTQYKVILEATLIPSSTGTLALAVANVAGASDTFNISVGGKMTVTQQQS